MPTRMIRERRLLFLCYTLSGFAALVYEIVWMRLLALHLGHTVAAVGTVLAAFLGGLGIGAVLGGWTASRRSAAAALRMFATLELGVGAFALAIPSLMEAMQPWLRAMYGDAGGSAFATARIVSSLLLVGLPATAMGATFPLAARWILDRPDESGPGIAALYAANTTGAALGAATAGFVLIPFGGLRHSTLVACACNAICGGLVFWISTRVSKAALETARYVPSAPRKRTKAGRIAVRESGPSPPDVALAGVALAVTGFVAVVNEVAWTRVLALVVGPTTYAFAAMLVVFITGLAVGSIVATRLLIPSRRPAVTLAILLGLLAIAPAWSMSRVEPAVIDVGEAIASSGMRFTAMVRVQAATAAAMLLPVALLLGASFPVALALAAGNRSQQTPRYIGYVYALNTAGAVAGSLSASLWLIPSLGLQRTIRLSALIALAGALAIGWRSGATRAGTLAILMVSALAGIAAVAVPRWDMDLLSAGAYKYAQYVNTGDLRSTLQAGTMLYHREGPAATVSVRRAAGAVTLAIDGKVDASTGGDMLTQKLLAHLPLLLHAGPRRVAIVGLGSGVTLGSALTHPIERADVVEISPEVVEASRYFEAENRRALVDPRVRLIVGDGRSHLAFSRDQYDVIVSEPSNPWMAGIAALFTREFFDAVRRRLTPGGIFCQWAHTYDIRESDLRSIAATFASVFPLGTMWLVGESDLLLIGSPSEIVEKLPSIMQAYLRPGVADDLRLVEVGDPDSLLTTYAGGPAELRAFARDAVVQTDDRMALEFSAPRGLFERDGSTNTAALRSLASLETLPPTIRAAHARVSPAALGRMLLNAEAYAAAYEAFSRAVGSGTADEKTLDGFLRAATGTQQAADAERVLSAAIRTDARNVPARVALSRLLASQGHIESAIATVAPLMRSEPDDPRAYEQAAAALAGAGDVARLRDVADYMHRRWPERPASAYAVAASALLEGRLDEAHRTATAALSQHPNDARLLNIAGAAAASLGRPQEARRAFESAMQKQPREPAGYVNLGLVSLESGDRQSAARWFAQALMLDPNSASARQGLARATGSR